MTTFLYPARTTTGAGATLTIVSPQPASLQSQYPCVESLVPDWVPTRTILIPVDITPPTPTVDSGPSIALMSRVAGWDSAGVTFTADEPIQGYEVRLVASDLTPRLSGALLESGVPVVGGTWMESGTALSISNSTPSLVLDMPDTPVPGDLLVASANYLSSTTGSTLTMPTTNLPHDWNIATSRVYNGAVNNVLNNFMLWKLADQNEPASYTFPMTGATMITKNGQIHRYAGGIDDPVVGSAVTTTAFGTTHAAPAFTPTADNAVRLSSYFFTSGATINTQPSTPRGTAGTARLYERRLGAAGVASGTDTVTTAASAVAPIVSLGLQFSPMSSFTISITDDEIVAAEGGVIEGAKLLKVFVQDIAGNWSV